jgi:leucyl-tRNA synthetase
VADKELPVLLPDVKSYEPTGTGESPLANIPEWVEVWGNLNAEGEFESLPSNDPKAKRFTRETNTMPQWAGSSWYYLRFIDPKNSKTLVAKDKEKYWGPVDVYVGGAEHATRHLIYARFWHKFLFDKGLVSSKEPFLRLHNVGLIQASDGRKMSKRYGNVVNPDDIVLKFGADSLRIYEMFMGPFSQAISWSTDNLVGARRFIERVWKVYADRSNVGDPKSTDDEIFQSVYHQTVKKVGEDIENFRFNTAISQLMIMLNAFERREHIGREYLDGYLRLIGNTSSIHEAPWPNYDPSKIELSSMTIAIQINGKLRETISVPRNMPAEEIKNIAILHPTTVKWLEGKTPKKVIYVEQKLVSVVL